MKPSRVRFTLRGLMLAVAVTGAILASVAVLSRRRGRFLALRDHHASLAPYLYLGAMGTLQERREIWHWAMLRKYERAARYPWLPVAPDPPEPE